MILGNDEIAVNPHELRRLRGKRKLTERTLYIEGVNDERIADLVAMHALRVAVDNHCGWISVKGNYWIREFNVRELNRKIGESPFRHGHGAKSEIEMKMAGGKNTYFDTTRKLWAVPKNAPMGQKQPTSGR